MELEKEIICSEVNNLTKDQKIEILNCIKNYNPNCIQTFFDGSRIDLNNLPESVIKALHTKIMYFLKS